MFIGKSGLKILKSDELKGICQAGGPRLDFVFVSACHSRVAGEAFAAVGVPHVVCVNLDDKVC